MQPTTPPPASADEPFFASPSQPPAIVATATKARGGLIVLTAFLIELVVIAAVGNQWVSKSIVKHFSDRLDRTGIGFAYAPSTYSWRFSPLTHGKNLWTSQLALIGVVFVVTALLVLAVARGAVTFTRVFFATWTSVVVSTQLGVIVRGLILKPAGDQVRASRLTQAFFGVDQPDGYTLVAGLELGLVVALVAAIVAVSTRRRVGGVVAEDALAGSRAGEPAVGGEPADDDVAPYSAQPYSPAVSYPPEPYSAGPYSRERQPNEPFPPDPRADERAAPDFSGEQHTTQYPVVDDPTSVHQDPVHQDPIRQDPIRQDPMHQDPPPSSGQLPPRPPAEDATGLLPRAGDETSALPRVTDETTTFPRTGHPDAGRSDAGEAGSDQSEAPRHRDWS